MDVSILKSTHKARLRLAVFFTAVFLAVSAFMPAKSAHAACSLCDPVFNLMQVEIINAYAEIKHEQTRRNVNTHTTEEFDRQREWDLNVYFNEYWGKAMMMMTEQLSAVALDQMLIVGTFFDAKHQMETQRLFGQLAAQAHKDYSPSEGLCTIGTTYRNLGYAEGNANVTSWILSRRSMARQLQNSNGVATEGQVTDSKSRTALFLSTYCDVNDNAGNLQGVCTGGGAADRKNKDVDYVRTLEAPMSINANFTDANLTPDETDLLALQANLFANTITKTSVSSARVNQDAATKTDTQDPSLQAYLDTRAVIAMRSVAQSSFNDLAGMKSAGTTAGTGNGPYIQAVIKQLSPAMSDADAAAIVGANPSYDAQMDVLTQKLLQDPQFYTDLYDKPANVARKGVALQALATIQDRDNYKSALRSEMLWSQILELQLIQAQSYLQNRVTNVK